MAHVQREIQTFTCLYYVYLAKANVMRLFKLQMAVFDLSVIPRANNTSGYNLFVTDTIVYICCNYLLSMLAMW